MIKRVLAVAAAAAIATAFPATYVHAGLTAEGTGCSAGVCLSVTLGTDTSEDACGSATSLDVTAGDPVNVCYRVSNGSADTLNYQWLGDDVDGAFLRAVPQTLAPGANYQYNRIFSAYRSETPAATWRAAVDQTTYTHDDTGASAFVDIAATGTLVGSPSRNSWVAMTSLPFPFRLYDQTSDQLCVSANGLLFFGVSRCPIEPFTPIGVNWYLNQSLPELPAPAIAPYWMHFYLGGMVHTQTLGAAPNRQFIVEWSNEQAWNAAGVGGTGDPIVAFEVVFDEASGSVSFEYQHTAFGLDTRDDGIAATVGLQRDASYADQYSYDTASLHDGESIVWTPVRPLSYAATAKIALHVGTPVIAVTPSALNASASGGGSTTLPLTIANGGDRDLNWSLQEAAQASAASEQETSRSFAHGIRTGKSLSRAPTLPTHAWAPTIDIEHRRESDDIGVPAYAIASLPSGIAYVSLDATRPGTLDTILDGEESDITAATFVGNDFIHEYAVKVTRSGALHAYRSTYGIIDTSSGVFSPIAVVTIPSITYVGALRWDPTSGQLYAITITSTDVPDAVYSLYTIDIATGASAFVASIHGEAINPGMLIVSFAISPSGLLYALDIVDNVLLGIDKTSGTASVIGPTGLSANYAQSIDFDQSTGDLYWAAYVAVDEAGNYGGSMYTLDVNSGHPTLIGPVENSAELAAFVIARPNPCLNAANVPWLSIGTRSGTTPGGQSNEVTLTLDAGTLSVGTYEASVCVYSNDANHSVIAAPVTFVVTPEAPSDRIFSDGFENSN